MRYVLLTLSTLFAVFSREPSRYTAERGLWPQLADRTQNVASSCAQNGKPNVHRTRFACEQKKAKLQQRAAEIQS